VRGRPRTPSPAPDQPISWSSGLARSGQWDVYAMRKSAPCALEHRGAFFLQRRLARHTLVLKKERTGPTAGETGPRCGRTCGATRRQRSDDRPLISNHALKKAAIGKMLWLWQRAADWRGPVTRANLFLNRRRATGPHARTDQAWSDGRGAGRFAAHFPSAPRDSHRL
jgi:hypothetical protein